MSDEKQTSTVLVIEPVEEETTTTVVEEKKETPPQVKKEEQIVTAKCRYCDSIKAVIVARGNKPSDMGMSRFVTFRCCKCNRIWNQTY